MALAAVRGGFVDVYSLFIVDTIFCGAFVLSYCFVMQCLECFLALQ